MGRYMRKCTAEGEIAVVGMAAEDGVRTRARTQHEVAMAAAKRIRKVQRSVGELNSASKCLAETRSNQRRALTIASKNNSASASSVAAGSSGGSSCVVEEMNCSSGSSSRKDRMLSSCCSSNNASSLLSKDHAVGVPDPEEEEINGGEFVKSMSSDVRERRATTPSSQLRAVEFSEDDMDSSSTHSPKARIDSCSPPPSHSGPRSTMQKMPPASEIEDFFAAAEKDLQKRFVQKYNFDFFNEVPLEGRYEWLPLKP